mmetsp:Transcript_87892/g.243853  ORF Transcript_87892/g.243853 Transcript_87892/m.243853 type:complete len:243 (-) Transcript_87892:642-1370(-)
MTPAKGRGKPSIASFKSQSRPRLCMPASSIILIISRPAWSMTSNCCRSMYSHDFTMVSGEAKRTSRFKAFAMAKSLHPTHTTLVDFGKGNVSWIVAKIITLPSQRLQSMPRVSALYRDTSPSKRVTCSRYLGQDAGSLQLGSMSSSDNDSRPSKRVSTSPLLLSPSVSTSSTSPLLLTRQKSARSVKTGPFRTCVPPLPKETPAATEGFRKIEPSTECESRLKSLFRRSCRSKIPAPAKQST